MGDDSYLDGQNGIQGFICQPREHQWISEIVKLPEQRNIHITHIKLESQT